MPLPLPMIRILARSGLARWLPAVRRRVGPAARHLHLLNDRLLSTPLSRIDDWSRHDGPGACAGIDLAHTPPPPCPFSGPMPAIRQHDTGGPAGLPELRDT